VDSTTLVLSTLIRISGKVRTMTAPHAFTAPARVNLLGEHTDYTGGLVLPMAIPFFTTATITRPPPGSPDYTFVSENVDQPRSMSADDRSPYTHAWSDYPVGVLRELQLRDFHPPPFQLDVQGNVPLGAGLSSSASIEVATCLALLSHANAHLPLEQIALLCQSAENIYVHSPCGIMDQFVVTAATAGHALLLDTATLHYDLLPMPAGIQVVICNSMVKHSVGGGPYGNRRQEVEAGQKALIACYPDLPNLAHATLPQLQACQQDMSPESFLRCRHVITENARVRQAKELLTTGEVLSAADIQHLGQLLYASHASQRDDFQDSTPEIDFLVQTASHLPGCFGARLTGGGFGGCTVNLVAQAEAPTFTEALKAAYREHLHIEAETYLCEAVDGAIARTHSQPQPAALA